MITLVIKLTIYVFLRILLTGPLSSSALYVHERKKRIFNNSLSGI